MKPDCRVAVAYIAGILISGIDSNSILDPSGKCYSMSGEITSESVKIFDHHQNCFIGGEKTKGQFSLFHHGDSHHIDLNINSAKSTFKGFDYGASCHFGGKVTESIIKLFDFGEGDYFEYSLQT